MYRRARDDSHKFYVGVDANARTLEKISEKIHRKPSKGGLSNALFVQAAVEDLPSELDGVAGEVRVHFPWGSLLRAIVGAGDGRSLGNLRRVCAPGALLKVIVGYDSRRDAAEWAHLGLPPLTVEYLDSILTPTYRRANFEVVERGVFGAAEWVGLPTTWAKRLSGNADRTVMYVVARATEVAPSARGAG